MLFKRTKRPFRRTEVYGFLAAHGQLTFTRWLPPFLFEQWISVINQAFSYNFADSKDIITWSWGKGGKFTSKSMYDHLSLDESGSNFKHLWKAKLPYKIKIFLWLLEKGVILTKDNLIKRKWVGDPSCYFCSDNENINHLFFCCPVAKVIWGIIAMSLGANNIPTDIDQYKRWVNRWLPNGTSFHTLGLAAFCWAIWKRRNKACFDKKKC